MFDDGKNGDGKAGDGMYGAGIDKKSQAGTIEYHVEGEYTATYGSTLSFRPTLASFAAAKYQIEWPRGTTSVWLNEFIAKNDAGIVDEKGEREDWIEIVNPTSASVTLGGMFLTDDLSEPRKWMIPAGTTLLPKRAMLIWADDEPGDGPLHATFKLDRDGEEIALFAVDGITLLDRISFGDQVADVSTGRVFDGLTPWVTFADPTPTVLNASDTCGTRRYSALDPTAHVATLDLLGTPKIGSAIRFRMDNGIPSGQFWLFLALGPANLPFVSDPRLLLMPPLPFTVVLECDTRGSASLPVTISDDVGLIGAKTYWQAFAVGSGSPRASNGMETIICPK